MVIQWYESLFLVALHSLNTIENTKYFNYESRFNYAYSLDNLPRIKDGAYMINLDEKQNKRTHWVLLFIDRCTAVILLESNMFLKKYQTK